jgi:nitrogen-specific signal transduction histidine kinase
MFLPLAASKRNELTFEFEPDLPGAIQGDAGKVRQVVINLLSNAVKFTEAGNIQVKTLPRTWPAVRRHHSCGGQRPRNFGERPCANLFGL